MTQVIFHLKYGYMVISYHRDLMITKSYLSHCFFDWCLETAWLDENNLKQPGQQYLSITCLIFTCLFALLLREKLCPQILHLNSDDDKRVTLDIDDIGGFDPEADKLLAPHPHFPPPSCPPIGSEVFKSQNSPKWLLLTQNRPFLTKN